MKLSLCIKFTFYVVSSIALLTHPAVSAEKLEVTPESKHAEEVWNKYIGVKL